MEGRLGRAPERRDSPAGVPILRFWLEHESVRREGPGERSVRLRIPVTAVGPGWPPLQAGSRVRIGGFLDRAGFRRQDCQLVLHAESIEIVAAEGPPSPAAR